MRPLRCLQTDDLDWSIEYLRHSQVDSVQSVGSIRSDCNRLLTAYARAMLVSGFWLLMSRVNRIPRAKPLADCRIAFLATALLVPLPAVAQNLMARKIDDHADLARGRGTLGTVGDYLLANDKVRVIIHDVRKRQGFAESGGNIGYFVSSKFDSLTQLSLEPGFTLDFDAIEAFNGKRVPEEEEVMRDWFHLLNAGHSLTATGNSDSHRLDYPFPDPTRQAGSHHEVSFEDMEARWNSFFTSLVRLAPGVDAKEPPSAQSEEDDTWPQSFEFPEGRGSFKMPVSTNR